MTRPSTNNSNFAVSDPPNCRGTEVNPPKAPALTYGISLISKWLRLGRLPVCAHVRLSPIGVSEVTVGVKDDCNRDGSQTRLGDNIPRKRLPGQEIDYRMAKRREIERALDAGRRRR